MSQSPSALRAALPALLGTLLLLPLVSQDVRAQTSAPRPTNCLASGPLIADTFTSSLAQSGARGRATYYVMLRNPLTVPVTYTIAFNAPRATDTPPATPRVLAPNSVERVSLGVESIAARSLPLAPVEMRDATFVACR